jgi:hypothetical protein
MGMLFEHQDFRQSARARKTFARSIALACGLLSAVGNAQEEPSLTEPQIATHGFVSQGYIKTTENNYLAETSGGGSFEFSEAGINVTASIGDDFRVGAQLFARDLGPIGNYDAKFDWYYLDYRLADWLGIRAGRTKVPFGLYNESSDIDASRVPVLLPQSVYPTENRDFLLAQTGAELYGYLSFDQLGGLEYRGYAGTVFLDPATSDELTSLSVPYVVGARLMWLNAVDGLQFGGSLQALKLDGVFRPTPETLSALEASGGMVPEDFDGTLSFELPAVLWVGSVEYTVQNLLLAAEYSQWATHVESTVPQLIPESRETSERFYAMASYHVASWFTPGVYYAATYADMKDRNGRDAYQHDIAATFRYDLTANWLLKLEGHYMHGTAGLDSDVNDGTPEGRLNTDWGAFLVKTTGYF